MVRGTRMALSTTGAVAVHAAVERRVECAIERVVDAIVSAGCPPRLAEALQYAVFPGGARLRPQLVLIAATSSGERNAELADAAAVAVELVHTASLVHDDLPCFDDADRRRGRPSLHKAYGEAAALLVGDGLIVHAFDILTRAAITSGKPELAVAMMLTLSEAAGARRGLVAGQAWELEETVSLAEYHRAKTATLFEASAKMGALAGGGDPEAWATFGEVLGRAYQVADDLADAVLDPVTVGKPTGRDAALGRPSLVGVAGVGGARDQLDSLIHHALRVIPPGADASVVLEWLGKFGRACRFLVAS